MTDLYSYLNGGKIRGMTKEGLTEEYKVFIEY